MSRNLKISLILIGVFALVLGAVALAGGGDDEGEGGADSATTSTPPAAVKVVRPSSHMLGEPGSSGVTFTEFLDFECEACAAAFPVIEQLREEYAGRITFVMRYFPIESHRNAMNAAIAVEAAAQQGRAEEMYRRMYETQPSWGEQAASKAALFRSFAEDLGLDMSKYDEAVAAPETQARVELDREDGIALGVDATPTFFINDEKIQPESVADLRRQLDAAIAATE